MAVTHDAAVRDLMCNAVVDALDLGNGNGTLVYLTTTDVEVARLTFSKPAFSDASDGTAIANEVTSGMSTLGGVVSKAKGCDSEGTTVFICSVGNVGSGCDIEVSSTFINAAGSSNVRTFIFDITVMEIWIAVWGLLLVFGLVVLIMVATTSAIAVIREVRSKRESDDDHRE